MTPERLLKNFFHMYAYSFWEICHPIRLLQTVFIRDVRVLHNPKVLLDAVIVTLCDDMLEIWHKYKCFKPFLIARWYILIYA